MNVHTQPPLREQEDKSKRRPTVSGPGSARPQSCSQWEWEDWVQLQVVYQSLLLEFVAPPMAHDSQDLTIVIYDTTLQSLQPLGRIAFKQFLQKFL